MKKTISLFLTAIIIMASLLIPIGVFAENNSIKVLFSNGNTSSKNNSIYPRFKVTNTSSKSINLSDLKLRYYYTIDKEQPQNFWCDHAGINSNNSYKDVTSIVTGSFTKLAPPRADADYYLEVGFKSGTLTPGATIEIQTRFAKNDWSNYDQLNDYSFSSSSSYSEWNKISAFLSGSLVFGAQIEIQNSTISPTYASFDKNTLKQADIPVTVSLNGNKLLGILNGSDKVAYTIEGNVVKISKEYLSSLPLGSTALTFDFSAGVDPVLNVTILDTTPKNSSISITSASFDKNILNQTDILVAITLNGNQLRSITNGSTNVPYDTYGDFVRIGKNYLASLPLGDTSLTFDFSTGVDPVLDLTIMDTTANNSSISITSASFDKNVSKQTDIQVTVSLNGNELLGIMNGSEKVPYSANGNTLSISKEYLASLPVADYKFTFNFNKGNNPELVVSVIDTTSEKTALTIGSADGKQGELVSVPIEISSVSLKGISRCDFTINYDTSKLEILNIVPHPYLVGYLTAQKTCDGVKFNFDSGFPLNKYLIDRCGTLASITFRIKHCADAGYTDITFDCNYKFEDGNYNLLNVELTNGLVNITPSCP